MRQYERWQVNIAIGNARCCGGDVRHSILGIPRICFHSEMWRFLIGDVAFLFVQVLLLTFFIDRLLKQREREAMLQKLNMVIGAFYSQIGTQLMGMIASYDLGFDGGPRPGPHQARLDAPRTTPTQNRPSASTTGASRRATATCGHSRPCCSSRSRSCCRCLRTRT